MTFHFAYPNVLPRKEIFIGCGRYTVFGPGKSVDSDYCEVRGAPNTPNKNTLKRAMQLLAAESFDSTRALYHKQDRLEEKYQGDSLDLAWFLAHILRTRKLCCRLSTDVWCTGVIQINSSPHLFDVDPDGFTLKLKAFLDPANTDWLFIVPLANIDPQARTMCEESDAKVIRLGSDMVCNMVDLGEKTVLTVPADGLTDLLDTLFIQPVSGKTKGGRTRLYLLLLALIGVAGIAGKPYIVAGLQQQGLLPLPEQIVDTTPGPPLVSTRTPEPDFKYNDIIRAVEQGDFFFVPALLQVDISDKKHELQKLRQQITQPLPVKGTMEYLLADGTRKSVEIDPRKTPPTLTHRDYYRLQISMNNPPDALYLYLFQVDSSGSLTPIFPSSQFNTKNPVRPWQWPIRIPEKEDKWIFLDKLSNTSQQQTREILYLLSSPWPARDIEMLSNRLLDMPDNEDVKAKLLARISVRQQADLAAITCIHWSFFHDP